MFLGISICVLGRTTIVTIQKYDVRPLDLLGPRLYWSETYLHSYYQVTKMSATKCMYVSDQ